MPKYKRKRFKRKRPYKRRRNYVTPISKSPMPTKYATKLRWGQVGLQINPGIAQVGKYIFRANSLYDPDYTSALTPQQPRGFDEIMPLYKHYTVIGSKISVQITNLNDAAFYTCFLTLQSEPNLDTDPRDWIERQNVTTKLLGSKSANPTAMMSKSYSTKKFFSRTNVLDDTTLRGDLNNSPTELAYFNLGAIESDYTGDPGPIYFNVTIDYIVLFNEANDVAAS